MVQLVSVLKRILTIQRGLHFGAKNFTSFIGKTNGRNMVQFTVTTVLMNLLAVSARNQL